MFKDALTDSYGRHLNYLRVSITDRCNINCLYCRKKGIHRFLPTSNVLSYEEIFRIVKTGRDLGINKVRITGGEPLVRKGLVPFLEKLVNTKGINDVPITTNGVNLKNFLNDFKQIGIKRLNISLDSLNRKTFETITGYDGFQKVWESIMTALYMGFSPLKVNMVVIRGINDHEIADFANLTKIFPLIVRYIEYMPSTHHKLEKNRQVLSHEIKKRASQGELLSPVNEKDNNTNSERFRFKDAPGELGFISPVSKHFCKTCNRLRLTADGLLRPCLLSDHSVNIGKTLRNVANDGDREKDLTQDFINAVRLKPGYLETEENEHLAIPRLMSAIGG